MTRVYTRWNSCTHARSYLCRCSSQVCSSISIDTQTIIDTQSADSGSAVLRRRLICRNHARRAEASFGGAGGVYGPPTIVKFFARNRKLKMASQLWNVAITVFFKPRNAPEQLFFWIFARTPLGELTAFPQIPFDGGEGACRRMLPLTQEPYAVPAIRPSGIVLQSCLARPPNHWLKWRFWCRVKK